MPEVVLDLGRGLLGVACKRGVVGEDVVGEDGKRGEELVDDTRVWNVLTGNLSTTDFGARQRLRRILDLNRSRAYTTVSVTSGLTTRTSRVSKKGLAPLVGVSVTHNPS